MVDLDKYFELSKDTWHVMSIVGILEKISSGIILLVVLQWGHTV